MGVVIGRMDSQVEKIFLGNNLTRNYCKMRTYRRRRKKGF